MSVEKVRAYLEPFGVSDRIREFDVSSATVELAAVAVGVEPARIARTPFWWWPPETQKSTTASISTFSA